MNDKSLFSAAGREFHPDGGEGAQLKAPLGQETGDNVEILNIDASDSTLQSEPEALSKIPSQVDRHEIEKQRYVDYVLNDSDIQFRGILQHLYHFWQDRNEEFFDGKLTPPHLTIAAGPPRAFAMFKSRTDYGGHTQITIDARVIWATRKFVHKPWPYAGTILFSQDLLKHEMVHQYLFEVEHVSDSENAKHGEAFADICNRMGQQLGLPRVFTRRRRAKDRTKPLTNFWPVNVRPKDYYLGHVTPPGQQQPKPGPALRGLAGPLSFFRYLIESRQTEKLATIIGREIVQTHEQVCTAKPAVEKGQISRLNPGWLTWNDGCIRKILHAIAKRRMDDLMPLLADALEAAGCGDELLLGHCRLPVRHTSNCWVVQGLFQA